MNKKDKILKSCLHRGIGMSEQEIIDLFFKGFSIDAISKSLSSREQLEFKVAKYQVASTILNYYKRS